VTYALCVCVCERMPVCKCLCQYVCTRVPQIWNPIDRFVRDFCERYVTGGRWNVIRLVKNT
jgi:hypothetical protein